MTRMWLEPRISRTDKIYNVVLTGCLLVSHANKMQCQVPPIRFFCGSDNRSASLSRSGSQPAMKCIPEVNASPFRLIWADDAAFNYMEEHADEFPRSAVCPAVFFSERMQETFFLQKLLLL